MSLVGPRPFVVYEDDLIDGWARRRLDLTPGITGLWQVLGRNDIDFEEMVEARLPLRHQLVALVGPEAALPDDPDRARPPRRVLGYGYMSSPSSIRCDRLRLTARPFGAGGRTGIGFSSRLCDFSPRTGSSTSVQGWGAALERFNTVNPIVAVDLNTRPEPTWLGSPNVTVMQADGTNLPFGDGEFDVGFSNSVIEHVPPRPTVGVRRRDRPGREAVLRPDAEPVLPDRTALSVAVLPVSAGASARPSTAASRSAGRREGSGRRSRCSCSRPPRLFPDAEIHREKVLGLTKSLIAVRR